MAVPTLTDGRTMFNSADTGNPTQMGGSNPAKKSNETAVHMQNTGCGGISLNVGGTTTAWSNMTGGQLSGTSVDLSGTSDHFWVWCSAIYLLEDKANHGIWIGISSSGNTQVSTFTFSGGDEYTGGFIIGCAHPSNTADTGTGFPTAATKTAVTGMGGGGNSQFSGETYLRSFFFDAMRVTGSTGVTNGYSVTGGTGTGANAVTLQDISDVDFAQANRYAICFFKEGSYLSSGEIHFGAAATNTYIADSNQTFNWLDLPVHTTNLYKMVGISGTTSTTSILLDNMVVQALGSTNYCTIDMSALTGTNDVFDCTGWNLSRATLAKFSSKCTVTNWTFNDCQTVFPNGITITNPTLNNCDAITLNTASDLISGGSTKLHNTATSVAYITTDDFDKIENHAFDNTAGTGWAIDLGTISATRSDDCDGNTFSGYSTTVNGNKAIKVNVNTGVTYTINVIGGSDLAANLIYNSGPGTVTVVVSPVTTDIHVSDNNGADLQNVRVLLEASDGLGDLPFEESVTITRSGTTASVTHTAHGLSSGDSIVIRGADEPEYNGPFVISNVATNSYDYTVPIRTNEFIRSEEFDNAAWTSIGTPVRTADVDNGPFATLTADSIEDNNAGAFEGIQQILSIPNDSQERVISIYIRKEDNTSPTFGMNMALLGGTLVNNNVRINLDTGETNSYQSGVVGSIKRGNYWRFYASIVNNSTGNTSLRVQLYPATNSNGIIDTDVASTTGTVVLFGAQGELGQLPTSYITTTTAAVTKPVTPATGTITSTGVVLNGLTDVSGNLTSSRSWGGNQNVRGFGRKSTSSPRFKSFPLAGNTILSASGLSINIRMVLDE